MFSMTVPSDNNVSQSKDSTNHDTLCLSEPKHGNRQRRGDRNPGRDHRGTQMKAAPIRQAKTLYRLLK